MAKIIVIDGHGASSVDLEFFTLPHPRHGLLTRFAIGRTRLLELQAIEEDEAHPSSWLLDNGCIISDGQLYLATVVDPLFVVLPLLRQSQRKSPEEAAVWCDINDIVTGAHSRLLSLSYLTPQLSQICEVCCRMMTEVGFGTVRN